jgi:HEPN domain-containing protein
MSSLKDSATQEWLVKAEHDIRAAEVLLTAEQLPDVAVYHCQQAAEKALKAFLFHHDVAFRKTHDLAELGEVCARLDQSLAGVVDQAIDLTPFAWQFRYPAENRGDPTIDDAREAIAVARMAYEAIRSRLAPA